MLNKSPIYINKLNYLLSNVGDMALKRRAQKIIEALNLQKGNEILDVGCGDGFYLHLLTNLNIKLQLTGIDCDANALKSARRNLATSKVKLYNLDILKKLPFKSNYFDKIILSEVLEHLPVENFTLTELHRILKPTGVLVISVPSARYSFMWDPINWVLEHFFKNHIKSGFWSGIWNQHIRLYTNRQIVKILKRNKFHIEICEYLTWWCLPFNHLLVNLVARLLVGKDSSSLLLSLDKYKTNVDKPWFIDLLFKIVNAVDKLNDILPQKGKGVGIIVKVNKI